MNTLTITLEETDLIELQVVLLDEDAAAALEFLRTRIAPRITTKGIAPCDSSRLNPFLPKSKLTGDGK